MWNHKCPTFCGWICSGLLKADLGAQARGALTLSQALTSSQLSLETTAEVPGHQAHSNVSHDIVYSQHALGLQGWLCFQRLMAVSILHLFEVGLCVWRTNSLKNSPAVGKALWPAACQWGSHSGWVSLSCHWEWRSGAQWWKAQERKVTPFFHSHFFLMLWANKLSSRHCYFNCWKQVQHRLSQGHPQNKKGTDTKVRWGSRKVIFAWISF